MDESDLTRVESRELLLPGQQTTLGQHAGLPCWSGKGDKEKPGDLRGCRHGGCGAQRALNGGLVGREGGIQDGRHWNYRGEPMAMN